MNAAVTRRKRHTLDQYLDRTLSKLAANIMIRFQIKSERSEDFKRGINLAVLMGMKSPKNDLKATLFGRSALYLISRSLLAFIACLGIIWIFLANNLVQQTLKKVHKLTNTVPTPAINEVSHLWSLRPKTASPLMLEEERLERLERLDALEDPLDRISSEFQIPDSLKRRTRFWFDIYTKFGKYEHVIHHTRYPWIIYKVVDGRSIIRNSKGPLWKRRQKVERIVRAERAKLKSTLKKLSRRKSFKRLSQLERQLYRKLKSVRGKRRTVFSQASVDLRSQLGQKDFFEAGLKRGSKYLPLMEEHFRSQGLPTELTRIPFVESSFNEKAESKVGASGVWQIMPRVGKAYMKVTKYIDERNSPIKATEVAAKLFKQNYRALRSWPLAVTAYNNGIGNIRKAMRAAKTKRLGAIINRYHRGAFKFASSNFFTCFLAALHAEKYHDLIFDPYAKEPNLQFREIRLAKRVRVKTLLRSAGLSTNDLLALNLDLKKAVKNNALLPKGFRLLVPSSNVETVQKGLSRFI